MNLEDQVKLLLSVVEQQKLQIDLLVRKIEELEKENRELRRRLNMDSSNSNKPPSSDSIFKKSQRPSRNKNRKRKPGGQFGHDGSKLTKFEHVDLYEDHSLNICSCCHSKDLHFIKSSTKQIVDIPIPKIEVTEHTLYDYKCNKCGQKISSPISKTLNQEVQYGPNIKSLVTYLNVYQLIPYKRLTELVEAIYGHKISQGSISNFNKEINEKLKGFINQLKTSFIEPNQVLHSDETACMVSKIMHWVHVYSNGTRTLLQGHTKRGRQAMDEIGILNNATGTLIHDRLSSYKGYDQMEHGLCNAHIIRELKAIEENQKLAWTGEIRKILVNAKEYKDRNKLHLKRAKIIQLKYEKILRAQRPYYRKLDNIIKEKNTRGKPKRSKDHNLFMALWEYKKEILLFMYRQEVPFDNNQAERDLRMFKVKMKISNHFLTEQWLNVYATIRSFISTAQKQNLNILNSLQKVYLNPEFATKLAV